ncbi:hypothetical protein AGMMS49965_17080 [Bacteroidia bacterium]|nr:hypothetical protein AGMMS49965_17080 [Bacteroidia bacterium]
MRKLSANNALVRNESVNSESVCNLPIESTGKRRESVGNESVGKVGAGTVSVGKVAGATVSAGSVLTGNVSARNVLRSIPQDANIHTSSRKHIYLNFNLI